MKGLAAMIVVLVLVAGAVVLVQRGRAAAVAPAPVHPCPLASTFNEGGFEHGAGMRIVTHHVSCAEALGVVRAMVSGIGVTFIGNPEGGAYQFRWKLYGLPGWTCYGDGSGFPEGGAGGDCARGSATVEWWHAS